MAQDEGEGNGSDLHSAANEAWKNAKSKGNKEGWFEIKRIEVKAENPITEYKVTIKRLRDLP
jgi:hypothetical protein